jgi:biotin carboxyl carrier protein
MGRGIEMFYRHLTSFFFLPSAFFFTTSSNFESNLKLEQGCDISREVSAMTTQLVPQSPNGSKSTMVPTPPQQIEPPSQPPEKPKRGSKRLLWLVGGVVIVAAIGTPTWYYLHRPVATGLQLSGRIEGYETDIGAKIPGRVNFVAVREGDRVQKGEEITLNFLIDF